MLLRVRFVPLFLLLLCIALVNCRNSNAITQGSEISLNLGVEPPTIDPALATDPPTIQLDHLLFLNLTNLNETDGAPEPSLAREWLVSSDGLIWEFRLRDDVNWVSFDPTNGQVTKQRPITADDVVYSARRILDPRTQSSFAHLFAPLIRNGERFNNADPRTSREDLQRLAESVGVIAKDSHTVQFQLTHPLSAFPAVVGTWLGRVMPREPIENDALNWTNEDQIWTSGPYILENWDHNREITLRKNPDYPDANGVQIERLHFRMIPDVPSALDAYLSGTLDTTDPYDSIEGDNLDRVQQDPALAADTVTLPGLCTQYIGFNITKPPFDNIQVRKAFATALNRDDLVSQDFQNDQPAAWFAPPQVNAAPDISTTLGVQFNAPLAKDMLTQSGARMPAITFGVNTNQKFIDGAVQAIGDWKAALGTVITVEDTEWNAYLDKLHNDAPPIFRLGYCGSYPDAANFDYDVFHSGSPYNFTHWSNDQYDKLVEQANRETDVLVRRQLYTRAEKILIEQYAPIIPLIWTSRVSLTKPDVERTHAIMEGYDRIENWRLKP